MFYIYTITIYGEAYGVKRFMFVHRCVCMPVHLRILLVNDRCLFVEIYVCPSAKISSTLVSRRRKIMEMIETVRIFVRSRKAIKFTKQCNINIE